MANFLDAVDRVLDCVADLFDAVDRALDRLADCLDESALREVRRG